MSKSIRDLRHSNPNISMVDRGFYNILQRNITNEFIKIPTVIENQKQLNLYGDAEISTDKFKLKIVRYNDFINGVRPTAKMLLDALIIQLTENGQKDTIIRLSLNDYMAMRGLKDKKSAREQVKEDIKGLDSLKIECRENRKGKVGDYISTKISAGINGVVNGVIVFRFDQEFFNLIKNSFIMPYPKETLLLGPSNSYFFLRRISQHKNMNYFKQVQGNIIGVKTILESSPQFPKYGHIKDIGGIKQRIIIPFEKSMNAIKSFNWRYCGKNGAKVDPPTNYFEFEALNAEIDWANYPRRNEPKKDSVEEADRNTRKMIKGAV